MLKNGVLDFTILLGAKDMFKRKAYDELKRWKEESHGKYAVLLEGARRVGKSTIVKEFAANEYRSFILVDFGKMTKEMLSVFEDIANLDLFFVRLQAVTNVDLYERESVIIFDEVQLYPKARQAIKYLVADGRYDYIETGSLISIKKNVDNILIPSEERKIEVCPMDYEEFCDAAGYSYSVLKKLYEYHGHIGDGSNRALIRNFRMYMAVGGMPQAVDAFVSKKNFNEIDNIKKDIIDLYKDDLRKIDKSGRLSKMYESIPAQLVAKKNRFSFGYGLGKKNAKDDERLFDLLDSKVINCCHNLLDISPSLSQYADFTKFKLYVGDTGLFVTMLFNASNQQHEDIYRKLLSDKLDLNLGYLYENVVAQMIKSSHRSLYYFTFPKENSAKDYEIDFLLENRGKVIPLEIRSRKINVHEAIDRLKDKYAKRLGQRYLVSCKDYFKDKDLVNLPYYLLPLLLENLS